MRDLRGFLINVVVPLLPLFLAAGLAGFAVYRRRKRESKALTGKIKHAIEEITKDGIVEGPKGPRVPHKKWSGGLGRGTPNATTGAKHAGYHGTPLP